MVSPLGMGNHPDDKGGIPRGAADRAPAWSGPPRVGDRASPTATGSAATLCLDLPEQHPSKE